MALYQNKSGILSSIHEQSFKLEKDIQKLIEINLKLLTNLDLVKSEFTIKNKRIDTLAFDQQTNGFVIIEYKRDRNVSVVDQGFSYLSLMLENKAEFIVEYNESLQRNLKRENVDWSQSRVVFVAPSFTDNQKLATNFKDVAIELWEVRKYDNEIISINQIRKTSKESIRQIASTSSEIEEVTKEIKVYTEEDHMVNGSEATQELYETLKSRILDLGDVEIKPTKVYIGFRVVNKIFTDVNLQKKIVGMRINLKKGVMDDPKHLFQDVTEKGHWGVGHYEAKIDEETDIDYLMSLIKQSYNYHKKSND